MTPEEINKAFNGRWHMMVENSNLALRDIKEAKDLCRDFFEAGVLLANIPPYTCTQDEDAPMDEVERDFEAWWAVYDKKCGKADARKKWMKMSAKERYDCYEATPAYVEATPDKQYRKHPLSFLNQKAWQDEIITRKNAPTDSQLVNDTAAAVRFMENQRRNRNSTVRR